MIVPALRAMSRRLRCVIAVRSWTTPARPAGRLERTVGATFMLPLAGQVTVHHSGGTLAAEPGVLLLFPERCTYVEHSTRPSMHLLGVARGDGVFLQVAERSPGTPPEMRTAAWSSAVGGRTLDACLRFALAADLPQQPAPAHRLAVARLMAGLLLDLLERDPVPAVPATGPPMVRVVLGIVDARSSDPRLTVASIAAEVGMHPSSLSRLMLARTGSGVLGLLRRARLDRAERLLADPRLKLAEVARRSGFGTVRRLRLAWRHDHQKPPGVVRRHAHRQPPL